GLDDRPDPDGEPFDPVVRARGAHGDSGPAIAGPIAERTGAESVAVPDVPRLGRTDRCGLDRPEDDDPSAYGVVGRHFDQFAVHDGHVSGHGTGRAEDQVTADHDQVALDAAVEAQPAAVHAHVPG